jgi:hypothetical protein
MWAVVLQTQLEEHAPELGHPFNQTTPLHVSWFEAKFGVNLVLVIHAEMLDVI